MPSPSPLEQAFVAELPFLRALARRMTDDADDLVHDAWLDASGMEPTTHGTWRPLLATVLRNRARMQARARTRRERREVEAEIVGSAPIEPDAASALAEVLRALADELEALPKAEREVLAARFVEGHSSIDIAAREGTSDGAVRSRIRRALDRLRVAMDRRHGGVRHAWAWAVLPMAAPDLAVSSTALGVTMGIATKLVVAGATMGALGVAWWLQSPTPVAAAAATATATATRPPAVAPAIVGRPGRTTEEAAALAAARARWSEKADRIRALRRARSDGLAAEIPTIKPDLDVTRKELVEATGSMPVDLRPLFESLVPQLVDSFKDCIELVPEGTTGRISVRASVISEPDVGAIVESVDTTEDSVGAQVLEQCVSESIYAFDLPAPLGSLTRDFDFTVDLDAREISAGTPVTLDQLQEMIAEHPELAEKPEIADALAQAQAQPPQG